MASQYGGLYTCNHCGATVVIEYSSDRRRRKADYGALKDWHYYDAVGLLCPKCRSKWDPLIQWLKNKFEAQEEDINMLNFEDEMKAVKKGYVVMSLDDYNELRDEIAAANMRAYEAEQTANRRMAGLLTVKKKKYGDRAIEIEFNEAAIRDLATEVMYATFSIEELAGYKVREIDRMSLYDATLADYKPDPVEQTDDE